MKRKFVVYGIIAVLVISGILFITGRKNHNKDTVVKTASAENGEIKAYLSTTGKVQSKNKKDYYGLQAEVKAVNVKVGDSVKKGDVLVTYNTQDLSSTVSQAQIQYDNAVLSRTELYNQNDSIKSKIADLDKQISELTNPGDAAKLEALKQQRSSLTPISNEKLKQADNSVKLAEISLNSAKQNLAKNKNSILAESSGVVTAVNVIQGAMGNMAQAAVTVQDMENLKVVLSVGKYDAEKVALGQEVIIKNANKTYSGKISFIDPAAKTTMSAAGSEAALGIEIDVLDKAPDLKIDFDVDIDILVGQAQNVVKVPAESLKVQKGNRNLVYVLENGIVHEREVTVGIQSDKEVEIRSGIKQGEKVILNPSNAIVEGAKAVDSADVKSNAGGKGNAGGK